MSNVSTAALTRDAASYLVKRAEYQTGSRMVAYEMVASTVGTSASWLRKFLAGREAKEPGWTTGWNILDQYSRICDRVEAEIETERTKILALKGQIDAATAAFDRVVESSSRTSPARKDGE
jgi:hypothetical protein